MANEFYRSLYMVEPASQCSSTDWFFPAVNHADRRWLNRPFTPGEIQAALFQMSVDKAPGPDGFTTAFFQKYWHVAEKPVVESLLEVFRTSVLPMGLNESIICLIPKCQALETLNHFRPISVCNVLVKIISKAIANRLKPMMHKLTGASQASFIPVRSTADNITAAQEVLHSLQRRKGTNGGFALKVDLEKAYDRVDWNFLREVLPFIGFN